ncbi:MAG: hypothetical protein GY838_03370 [bacterium]|nr:hypothetical protein [bacterium]
MNTTKLQHLAATVVAITILAAVTAPAQAQTVDLSFQWTAPASGSTVQHYVVQHQVDGGAWTDVGTVTTNQFTLAAIEGSAHSIRVAGVDSQDRQGVWSEASAPYTPDPGAPGQPGRPIIF